MSGAVITPIWHHHSCAYPGCKEKKVFNGNWPTHEEWGDWSYWQDDDDGPNGFYCPRHSALLNALRENPCEWCGRELAVVTWDEGIRVCGKCDAAADDDDLWAARRTGPEPTILYSQ